MSFLSEYYPSATDADLQAIEKLWQHVLTIEPGLEEGLSYGLPALKLDSRPLVGFGIQADHMSLYPFSPKIITRLHDEFKSFKTTKGAIQFTADTPIPLETVEAIIDLRKVELTNSGFKHKKSGIEMDAKDPIFDVMSDKELDEANKRIFDLLDEN